MRDSNILCDKWIDKINGCEKSGDCLLLLEEIIKYCEENESILTAIEVHEFLIGKEISWKGYHSVISRISDMATLIVLYNVSEKFESIHHLISCEIEIIENSGVQVFPMIWYQYFSILGHISKYWGDIADADRYFGVAEKFSDIHHGPFRYHRNIGIVKENDTFLDIMKSYFVRKKLQSFDESWCNIRDIIEQKAKINNWNSGGELYRKKEQEREEFHRRINILGQPIVDHLRQEYGLQINRVNQLIDILKEHPEITPYLLSLLKDWKKYKFNIGTILGALTHMDVEKYGYKEIVEIFKESALSDYTLFKMDVDNFLINLIPRNRSILIPVFIPFLKEKRYGKQRGTICSVLKNSRDPNIINIIISLADDEDLFYMFSNSQWRGFWKKNKPEMLELWGTKEIKKKRRIQEDLWSKTFDEHIMQRNHEIFSLSI